MRNQGPIIVGPLQFQNRDYILAYFFIVLCAEISIPIRSLYRNINAYIIPKRGLKDLREDRKDEKVSDMKYQKLF